MKKLYVATFLAVAALSASPALAQQYIVAPTYAVAPAPHCPQLSYNLYRGLSDYYTRGQVSQLQQFLAGRYGNQGVTGYYGNQTWANVARFQREFGLYPITGGVGPLTRAAIARVCGGVPMPTHASLQLTSPQGGQSYQNRQIMPITWNAQNAPQNSSVILDYYTAAGTKAGTIAISSATTGTYQWNIPRMPNAYFCTMQYPNGLCGANVLGQGYIKATLVSGSGFDQNATVYATAQTGVFTIY